MNFSPLTYGAAGNGISDDTAAVQACLDDAGAAFGTVDLGKYRFRLTAPLTIPSGITIRCDSPLGASAAMGLLFNNTTDLIQVSSQNLLDVVFENVTLAAGAPGKHVINMLGTSSLGNIQFFNCGLNCNTTTTSVITTVNATDTVIIGLYVGRGSYVNQAPAAIVPAFNFVQAGGGLNCNTFENMTLQGNSANTAHARMIHVEATGMNYQNNWSFRNINVEACASGFAELIGVRFATIENVAGYDTNYLDDWLSLNRNSHNIVCWSVAVRNSGTVGGTFSSGKHLINDNYSCVSLNVENPVGSGTLQVFPQLSTLTSVPPVVAAGTIIQGGGLQAAGGNTAESWSLGRWMGTTASGPPVASWPYSVGDWVITQTGKIYVCTAAGSPGVWQPLSPPVVSKSASYTITPADGTVFVDATTGPKTITLLTAVGRAGQKFTIKKTDTTGFPVGFATVASQTIDGLTNFAGLSLTSSTGASSRITFQSDGADWHTVG